MPTEEIAIDQLTGTAKSLAHAATKAGYRILAVESIQDGGERSITLGGRMFDWGFTAHWTERQGWTVRLRRPGWPETASNVTHLRNILRMQTPTSL